MTEPEGAPPPPAAAEWLSTQACNLRCSHCAPSAGKAAEGELDTAQARDMLDALARFGVRRLGISGGELSTRPDWEALLDHALARFDEVMLTTNGFLGSALAERLEARPLKARLHVSLSLDGPRDVHDGRRARGSHDRLLEALAGLRTIERELITTVARDNLEHVAYPLEVCLAHGASAWTLQPAVPVGRLALEHALSDAELARLHALAQDARRHAAGRLRVQVPEVFFGQPGAACPCGRESLVVRADGSVSPCVFPVGAELGNVRSDSLDAMWQGEAMTAFRDRARRGCAALAQARWPASQGHAPR